MRTNMTDKERELERQIAQLAVEVSRLRKVVVVGFVLTGVILVTGLTNPEALNMIAAVGIVLWALYTIGSALGTALVRRHRRSRGHSTSNS